MMSKYFILLAFLFATVLVLSSTAETIILDDSIKAVDVGKLAENKVDANVVPSYCRWGCCGHGGYGGGCRCCSQPHDTQAQAMPEKQIEGEERIHIDAGQGGGSSGGSQGGGKGSGGGQGGGGKGGSGSGGSQGGGKGGSGGKGGGKGGGGGGSMHVGVEDLGGYGGGGRGGGGYGEGGGRGGRGYGGGGRGGYGGGGGGSGY